jgi:hypothetical protein
MEQEIQLMKESWNVVFRAIANDLMALTLAGQTTEESGDIAQALITIETYLSEYIKDLQQAPKH